LRLRGTYRTGFDRLECRLPLSLSIQFDYSYDSTHFFTENPAAKVILEQAGQLLGSRINDSLSAIVPEVNGANTWSEEFANPSDGTQVSVSNPTIPANTIVVYAAGSPNGSFAGEGGPGGYNASGSAEWNSLVATRGASGAAGLWGGTLSVNTSTPWGFADRETTPSPDGYDFFTVALHELGHILGIGTTDSWRIQVNSSDVTFLGIHAEAMYGGPVPLNQASDVAGEAPGTHWGTGILSFGVEPSVDVTPLSMGSRKMFTSLDWAGLQDVGWHVDQAVVTSPPPETTMVGTGFGLTVSIEDPDGHIDTTFSGPVTITLGNTTNGAVLSGTTTVNANKGIATFNGLSFNDPFDSYTLVASADRVASTITKAMVVGGSIAPIVAVPQPVSEAPREALTIVGVVPLESIRGRRHKLIGFEVIYSSSIDASGALDSSNYVINETVRMGRRRFGRRIALRTGWGTSPNRVDLILVGRHPFRFGGSLVVSSTPASGTAGVNGSVLLEGALDFTILPRARGVR
jgi:hypothetical protein